MANLDGSSRQFSLGQGISVRAPGLRGEAEAHNVAPGSDTRAPEVDGSGVALDTALTQEGFLRLRVITLDVAPVPHRATRLPGPRSTGSGRSWACSSSVMAGWMAGPPAGLPSVDGHGSSPRPTAAVNASGWVARRDQSSQVRSVMVP